ncbi:hypothetical protein [Nocardioides zeicaulis]|uniref:Lipoprotein n=1 Tax=Nocardioides zeicaulis TaxID=1776857 RepID=A0ABV6DZL6_9ACTN
MRPLAYVVLAATGLLAGCGTTGAAPSDHARSACEAYDRVTRHPVATTSDQWTALLDLARSNARAAAAFDARWDDLGHDVEASLDLRAAQDDGFLDADRRVETDCADAGHDIGDLEP